ncbi:MAG: PDZ domain-containing protein [Proteobacteria bacterium]|nr:PDZ domain-containing protein [Pseudomonadota bacterium]
MHLPEEGPLTFSCEVELRPEDGPYPLPYVARRADGSDRGATFEELPLKLRSDRIKGVLLSGLESGSQLARNGLRPGDIITAVNRQGISDLSDFQGAVGSVRGGLYLQFHRNGGDYRARID